MVDEISARVEAFIFDSESHAVDLLLTLLREKRSRGYRAAAVMRIGGDALAKGSQQRVEAATADS